MLGMDKTAKVIRGAYTRVCISLWLHQILMASHDVGGKTVKFQLPMLTIWPVMTRAALLIVPKPRE